MATPVKQERIMDTALEPYLTGVYTPVADERDDADLAVTGELPPNLRGQFLRNGPNPMFADAALSRPRLG
ncbi:MAG: carotenoid oxygenase family protein [Acidimicrobiia bacterium]